MNKDLLINIFIIFLTNIHFCFAKKDLSKLKINSEGKFKIVQVYLNIYDI